MSSPDFYLCDVCGGRVPKENRFWVATDRRMDAAGSMDDEGHNFDLCLTHAVEALKHLTQRQPRVPDYDTGNKLAAFIERIKKR